MNSLILTPKVELIPASDAKERTLKSIVSRINQGNASQSSIGKMSLVYGFSNDCSDEVIEKIMKLYQSLNYKVPH